MPTKIIHNDETAQVRLLRSMYVRGEYHAAGSVVSLGKRDAREMVYQERAVPFVPEATPPPAVTAAPVEVAPAVAAPDEDLRVDDTPAPAAETVAATDSAPAPSLTAPGGETTPEPVAEPAAVEAPLGDTVQESNEAAEVTKTVKARRTRKTKEPAAPAAETDNAGASV